MSWVQNPGDTLWIVYSRENSGCNPAEVGSIPAQSTLVSSSIGRTPGFQPDKQGSIPCEITFAEGSFSGKTLGFEPKDGSSILPLSAYREVD